MPNIWVFEPEYTARWLLSQPAQRERARAARCASIGIILCAEKDNLEVDFTWRSKSNPMGVAKYQLQGKLRAETKENCPPRATFTK